MAPRRFADVALPLPVDRPFTYAIPPALQDRAAVGMRAVAPVKQRIETGYIVALREAADIDEVRPIIDLPDAEPVITADILKLCRWIAEYYCCSLGEALQCAVPRGIRVRTMMRYTLAPDQLNQGRFTDRQKKIVAALYNKGPQTDKQLAKIVGATALSNTLQSLARRGVIFAETLASDPGVSMRTETWAVLLEDAIPKNDDLETLQRRAPKQAAIYLDLLHAEPARAATALYEKHGANATVLRALEEKGLIRREEREIYRRVDFLADEKSRERHDLNPGQQAAYDAVIQTLESKKYGTFLLQGITGSGKTEVYLQIIERALKLGRDAILLVPEISLTPQTVGRFLGRFNEKIAVLHSGLSAGERYDEWRRARRGEVRIVVGARSALFAPLPNLGVVVVDEEHDTSYKQGETPRYHARDVAVVRAQMNNGICILGSATPSVESYHNSERGKFRRLELRERATNANLPEVEVVDLRVEAKELSGELVLSRPLENAMKVALDRGEQIILLLNRRGHSPFVLCPKCAWVAECNDCQVSMTYHARGAFLSCHYCNARRPVPQVCDTCHFNPLIFLGLGTQKTEDYLQRAFPQARIERMDRDTTAGKGGHAKILGRFAAGEIDILVGTQMLAKGHDYPGVTLVGVLNADLGLAVPDFRAAEQTFQLLTQVAGRAGRGGKPGEVIVQTYRPRHFAVQAAAKHDFHAFYEQEIAQREAAGYPPFRRLVQFMVDSESGEDANRWAVNLRRIAHEQVEALNFQGVEVVGPAPASVRRVKKRFRWNVGAFSRSAKRLNELTRAIRTQFEDAAPNTVSLRIDLDPYGMF